MKTAISIVSIDPTEEYVMNDGAFAPELKGWRMYRIEYGGCNEDCVWEGRILLPPSADSEDVSRLILGMQAYGQVWTTIEPSPKSEEDE